MRISFWYEYGGIEEIGTGHKYRSHLLGSILKERGHKVHYIEGDAMTIGEDIIVIDHMFPSQDVVNRAKRAARYVIAIDGVCNADTTISACVNPDADYTGIKYMAFPTRNSADKYCGVDSRDVFVGMGGYDHNNYAEFVSEILGRVGYNAVVAKSINHNNVGKGRANVRMFCEDNYYDAMDGCVAAITNGGLTLYQALYYGMPTVAIPQYGHQRDNIDAVSECCVAPTSDSSSIEHCLRLVLKNKHMREDLSRCAQKRVDGLGAERICNIIEACA